MSCFGALVAPSGELRGDAVAPEPLTSRLHKYKHTQRPSSSLLLSLPYPSFHSFLPPFLRLLFACFIPGGGLEFFSSPPRHEQLWGPPSLLSNGYQGLFPWG